jgi:hypothetical protein
MSKLRKKILIPAVVPTKLWQLLSKFLILALVLTLTQQIGPISTSLKFPTRMTNNAEISGCNKPRTTLWCKEPGVCICVFDLEGCTVYEYETGLCAHCGVFYHKEIYQSGDKIVIYCRLRWEYVIALTLASFMGLMLITYGAYKMCKYGFFTKEKPVQAQLVNDPVVNVGHASSGRRLSIKQHEVDIGLPVAEGELNQSAPVSGFRDEADSMYFEDEAYSDIGKVNTFLVKERNPSYVNPPIAKSIAVISPVRINSGMRALAVASASPDRRSKT